MLLCMEGESLVEGESFVEGESLETVYQFDYLGCRSRFTSDGDHAADMRHRRRALALSRLPVARQPLTIYFPRLDQHVTEAAPLHSERLLDLGSEAWTL